VIICIENLPEHLQLYLYFRHSYKEARGSNSAYAKITSTAFHKHTHILVTGFEDGDFFLHEMPDFNLIHSLRYNCCLNYKYSQILLSV